MVSFNNPYYIKRGTNIERRITLFREVNSRIRYYSLHISMTLFGEYLLIRENGSVKNKKPTRVVKEYYTSLTQAMKSYRATIAQKRNKGYLLDIKKLRNKEQSR